MFKGSASDLFDDIDVYSTYLVAGRKFTMALKPDDLGRAKCIAVLGACDDKGVSSVAQTTELTPSATYTPAVSGIYPVYMSYRASSDVADYELTVAGCYHPGSLTRWSQGVERGYSLTPEYGQATRLTFTLMPTFTTHPMYYSTAEMLSSDDGKTWRSLGTRFTEPGYFNPMVESDTRRHYRFRWDGDDYYAPSTSGIVTVTPKVRLTRATSWRTITCNTVYGAKGFIEPRHSSGDPNKVKIRAYKKGAHGKYRYVKSFIASYSYHVDEDALQGEGGPRFQGLVEARRLSRGRHQERQESRQAGLRDR